MYTSKMWFCIILHTIESLKIIQNELMRQKAVTVTSTYSEIIIVINLVFIICRVGPPKTDGLWWRVLRKRGPLGKGTANHFSILALRTTWTAWKGKKIGHWKVPNMLLEKSGEVTPETKKRQSQSKNNAQLWMWLVMEVSCCKDQYCIGAWNGRSMNQGKLEVVKHEMAWVNIDILGISELKWIGMGKFNSDDH